MPGLDPGHPRTWVAMKASKTWMAGIKPGHDDAVCERAFYRDTCADTASHLPFCFAQQSV